jgi:acyl-CoA thioesterase
VTGFSALLGGLAAEGDGFALDLPESWTQGRTAYGGLSAALCVEAARLTFPDLPPLRALLVSFAGPASGRLTAKARLVRRGKSAAVMEAAVDGEAGPATRALLTYGAARASGVTHGDLVAPAVPGPDGSESYLGRAQGPRFAENFEMRLAAGNRPMSGGDPRMTLWCRHRDASGTDPATAFVALPDAPPPAAMASFTAPAPISTMSWSLDFAAPPPPPDDWVLVETVSDSAADGYSVQSSRFFDANGHAIALARQTVAVFA